MFQELRMYYDGNSGRYLIYDEETKQYHFQNGEEVPSKSNPSQKRTNQWRAKHKVHLQISQEAVLV